MLYNHYIKMWEYHINPEGEIKEMIEFYTKKGMDFEDADRVVRLMAKHKKLFIDVMMVVTLANCYYYRLKS